MPSKRQSVEYLVGWTINKLCGFETISRFLN